MIVAEVIIDGKTEVYFAETVQHQTGLRNYMRKQGVESARVFVDRADVRTFTGYVIRADEHNP